MIRRIVAAVTLIVGVLIWHGWRCVSRELDNAWHGPL